MTVAAIDAHKATGIKATLISLIRQMLKPILVCLVIIGLWQWVVSVFAVPSFIVPTPLAVAQTLVNKWALLAHHGKVTLIEIVLGLLFGFGLGLSSALLMMLSQRLSQVMMPIFIISQAIPVFAIAPLLVLWLGYGMASKVVMAVLIIYFPVTATCFDGLRNAPKQWLDLGQSLQVSKMQQLYHIRLPAALPSMASGLRIATTFAPIGAVVGEWVGAAEGLGYLMLQANARMQASTVFAALIVLVVMSLSLYFIVDYLLTRLIPWQQHL